MSGHGARLLHSGVLVAVILVAGITPAHAAKQPQREPVNRVVVDEGGVGTLVPPPGWGVLASVLTEDGHQLLVVETRRDGRVLRGYRGPERSAAGPGTNHVRVGGGVSAACRDGAWGDLGVSESDTHRWYFNPAHLPDNLGARQARQAVVAGREYFSDQRNDCGYSRMSSGNPPTTDYRGTTSTSTNITAAGLCGWGDGRNVVGFDDIRRSSAIAVSCVWYWGNEISEADVVLDTTGVRWTTDPGRGCARSMDIASVVVHETGHTFGLAHPKGSHPGLSMNSVIMACSTAYRTLGRGDIRGIRAKYSLN